MPISADRATLSPEDAEIVRALEATWDAIAADAITSCGGEMSRDDVMDMVPDYVDSYGHKNRAEARRIANLIYKMDDEKLNRLAKVAFPEDTYVI
jgi:hypothetical protein